MSKQNNNREQNNPHNGDNSKVNMTFAGANIQILIDSKMGRCGKGIVSNTI
jgi:hypothetical protein